MCATGIWKEEKNMHDRVYKVSSYVQMPSKTLFVYGQISIETETDS